MSKSYGGAAAVRDVSLSIAAGEFVAVVGGSGSGKTTTLKTINRLVIPDGGAVRIDGVVAEAVPDLRRRIGYVFQGVGLFPHMSVAENVGITLRLIGRAPRGRVDELLDLVGLPRGYGERRPDELSGGERQRVGVARALAAEPAIMLMDEPFGALDPVTRDALGTAYRALHGRLGLTTVMVTHDMAEALLLADRIVVMAGGRVVADATPAAVMADRAGPEAAALAAVPRAQAERLRALAGEGD